MIWVSGMASEELKQAKIDLKKAEAQNDPDGMIRALDRMISIEPKQSSFMARGDAHVMLGNHPSAIDDYHRAVELAPEDGEAYKKRGITYYFMGLVEQSIDDLSKAIELDPRDETGYYNRGAIYLELEEYKKAVDDFSKAIEIAPLYIEALGNRGNAFDALGQYEEAVADFDRVISIEPDEVMAYFNRANEYVKLERYEDAIRDYSFVIDLEPENADALLNRGEVLFKAKLNDRGLEDLLQVTRLDPVLAVRAYSLRAEIYSELGDKVLSEENESHMREIAPLAEALFRHSRSDDQLLERLSQNRSPLNKPRRIDHCFYCPADRVEDLVESLEKLGLTIDAAESDWTDEPDDALLVIEGHELASPDEMRERTPQLVRAAFAHGATYDGWGT